jgi:hypothetical protein
MTTKDFIIKTAFMKKIFFLLTSGLFLFINSFAQDDAKGQNETDSTAPVKTQKFTKNTFQGSSIINMHSVEIAAKNNLQFVISHHFGVLWDKNQDAGQNLAQVLGLNSGIAHTYLSLDYSVTNYANLGFAMTGNSKFEGWVKFKILRQQTGEKNIPVTIGWISLVNVDCQSNPADTIEANKLGWNKFSYMHQLLIARKFSSKFSLQLMPTLIHYNLVPYGYENSNNIFSMGLGGKYQLGKNKALTFEYAHQFNMYDNVISKTGAIINYYPNLVSLGMEFNTGGHIFQFYVGNTTAATNIDQLSRNVQLIKDGQFALGFRLNRSFFVGKE